jgi:hypothetical protein
MKIKKELAKVKNEKHYVKYPYKNEEKAKEFQID